MSIAYTKSLVYIDVCVCLSVSVYVCVCVYMCLYASLRLSSSVYCVLICLSSDVYHPPLGGLFVPICHQHAVGNNFFFYKFSYICFI